MMPRENFFQCFSKIVQQMPAVGNLLRMRRSTSRPIGIGCPTISANNLNRRMSLKPGGKGFGSSVGKQIDGQVLFQIDQDRSVALPLAPSPLVYSHHPHTGG